MLYAPQTIGQTQFLLGQPLVVSVDFTSATWNTVATHELFNVSGTIAFRLIAQISETLTSGGSATLSIGNETDNAAYCAAVAVASLTANGLIFNGSTAVHGTWANVIAEGVVCNSDIGYNINTAAMTDGTINFYLFYVPMPDAGGVTSSVAAGTGEAL